MFKHTFPNLRVELSLTVKDFYNLDECHNNTVCWIEILKHHTSQKIYLFGGEYFIDDYEISPAITKPIVNQTKLVISHNFDCDIVIKKHNPNKPFMYSLKIYAKKEENLKLAIDNISKKIEPYEKLRFLENL